MPDPPDNPSRATKIEELLDSIVAIVRRTGLAGFSLDTLAAEIGTSSRMLVYYFGSKDELLGRIVYAIRRDHVQALEASSSDTILEAIDAWWGHYRSNLSDMQFFFHLATRSFEEPEKFKEFSSTAVNLWTSYFHKSLKNDDRSDAEAQALARLVLATVRGLMVDLLVTGDKDQVEASLEAFKARLE